MKTSQLNPQEIDWHTKPAIEIQNNLRNDVRILAWFNPKNNKAMIKVCHASDLLGTIVDAGSRSYVMPILSRARNTAAPHCCPKCGGEKCKKAGTMYRKYGRMQRYRCSDCQHYYTEF